MPEPGPKPVCHLLRSLGSIGHITSAAAVAASSFDMQITNPKKYLERVDIQRLRQLLSKSADGDNCEVSDIKYVEPAEGRTRAVEAAPTASSIEADSGSHDPMNEEIQGKVQRLGDFVDTDAV